jgi:hypothetical protein
VIELVLRVDHPHNLDGNKEYAYLDGYIGRQKMGGQLENEHQKNYRQEDYVDDHVFLGILFPADTAQHVFDLIAFAVVLLDFPKDVFFFFLEILDHFSLIDSFHLFSPF